MKLPTLKSSEDLKDERTELYQSLLAKDYSGYITTLKALGLGVITFTLFSGVVFTIIPLIMSISNHIHVHVILHLERWLSAEPVTGNALMFIVNLSLFSMVLFFLKDLFRLIWINIRILLAEFYKTILGKTDSEETL